MLKYRIPDLLLISFLLSALFLDATNISGNYLARFMVSSISLFIFTALWYFTQGIGLGDVKYAALLGFLLGPESIVTAFLVTASLGVLIYLLGIIVFKWSKTIKIPYAPFLSAGAIVAVSGIL